MATCAAEAAKPPHVAIFPSPGMGHLIPLSEFAKRLVGRHGFTVSFMTTDSSPKTTSFLAALPSGITTIPLPSPPLDDLGAGCRAETIICHTMARSCGAVRDVLETLKSTTRLVAFVADLFGADTLDVARTVGVPHKYVFFPTNAMVLQLFRHLRELDERVDGEYRDMDYPTRLPGCVPLHGRDFLAPLQDRGDPAYRLTLRQSKLYDEADGIIVNTSTAIEPEAIREFELQRFLPEWKVYPVGPLVRTVNPDEEDRTGCVEWLDNQPDGSVLFVSFGSGGTLSPEQQAELAIGLGMSGQRFVWAIRNPSEKRDATFFSVDSSDGKMVDSSGPTPSGLGFLVRNWAPQVAILRHRATGGFLTHCGWNSTLESVVNGVPMIAWPLYAEQRMNAVMLTEKVGVAIRADGGGDGLVRREEISRLVTVLMDGEEGRKVRRRVRDLQEEVTRCFAENGSSCLALDALAIKWKQGTAQFSHNNTAIITKI